MGAVKNRYLVVIEGITGNVGCGIEFQQRLGLRADRDYIAGKRLTGFGIVDDDGLSKRIDQVGKVAGTLRRRRDKAGIGLSITVARPDVANEKIGRAALHAECSRDRRG